MAKELRRFFREINDFFDRSFSFQSSKNLSILALTCGDFEGDAKVTIDKNQVKVCLPLSRRLLESGILVGVRSHSININVEATLPHQCWDYSYQFPLRLDKVRARTKRILFEEDGILEVIVPILNTPTPEIVKQIILPPALTPEGKKN